MAYTVSPFFRSPHAFPVKTVAEFVFATVPATVIDSDGHAPLRPLTVPFTVVSGIGAGSGGGTGVGVGVGVGAGAGVGVGVGVDVDDDVADTWDARIVEPSITP
jgi:hypothetical protein